MVKKLTSRYLVVMKIISVLLITLFLGFNQTDDQRLKTSAALDNTIADTVRVATWNLKLLGRGKKNYELVAKLIENNFDVVALQEVMTEEGLKELVKRLSGWSYSVSDRVGNNGYYERYGVLTRKTTGRIKSIRIVPDPANTWTREPAVACVETTNVDFCLVIAHIVFGKNVGQRDREISSLASLVNNLRSIDTEKDYILLGDFNRGGNSPGFTLFPQFGFKLADDGVTNTSLGPTGYASPYDHILLDPNYTREWKGVVERIDIVKELCDGNFKLCNSDVSDHAPLGFLLDNTAKDDD